MINAFYTSHFTLSFMNRTIRFIAALLVFAVFTSAEAAGEAGFWKWFTTNDARLFAVETDQPAIFDEVSKQLSLVNKDLTFELGPVQDGKREFVISAGGIASAFPAVEALYSKAPSLSRWEWVKFRPRRLPLSDLQYGTTQVKVDDVRYLLAKDGNKVGIMLFFDGYSEKEKDNYDQLSYLFLDEALGEYAIETQVGFIEAQSRSSAFYSKSSPLRQLPIQFDNYWDR
jgi:hypothetical protein